MSIALLFAIGGLTTVGIYLITARSLSRVILGFSLLGHAAVLSLLTAGGPAGRAPIAGGSDAQVEMLSNPLPQALALTAIVISFGLTLFLLALAVRQQSLTGNDRVEDDLEDRRIARDSDMSETHRSEQADEDIRPAHDAEAALTHR